MARFIDSATLILLVAVVLFCSDAAYTSAICRKLQIDSNMFERSVYQSLYNGFKLNLGLMLDFSLYGTFGCAFWIWVNRRYTQVGTNDNTPTRFALIASSVLDKINSFCNVSDSLKRASEKSKLIGFLIDYSLAVLFFALFLSVVIYNEYKGKVVGESVRAAILDGTASQIRIGESQDLFFHLYCGGSMCAAINLENKEIKYYPSIEQRITSKEISDFYHK